MTVTAKTKKTVAPLLATTGALIDEMWSLRELKRKLEAEAKSLEDTAKEIETLLFEKMGKEGLEKATGTKASVSISSSVTADIQDWDAFNAYVKKTGFFHLYQRRISDPAYRELLDAGKKVPGAQPFTRKRLNIRSLA